MNDKGNPRLVLPPLIEVVPGTTASLYLRSTLLEETSPDGRVEINCSFGEVDEENSIWSLNADEDQVGEFPLRARLISPEGQILYEAKTRIRVIPKDAGKNREISLLFVGDSLTHMSLYPNEVARLLSESGNPQWRMLGLHRPAAAVPGVAHEGYGGWTWERFNTSFHPNKPPGSKMGSSPFLFDGNGNEKASLDLGRYFNECTDGQIPDLIVFLLGINDCFSVDPDDSLAIEKRIDEVLGQAEKLLEAFRIAAPNAIFGICLTPEPNSRQTAFAANYKDRYTRHGWRRIQYRLVERQLEQFGGRVNEGIYLIPTSLVVDPVSGYPSGNAVHPNKKGFDAIGTTIYAWVKGRIVDAKVSGINTQ